MVEVMFHMLKEFEVRYIPINGILPEAKRQVALTALFQWVFPSGCENSMCRVSFKVSINGQRLGQSKCREEWESLRNRYLPNERGTYLIVYGRLKKLIVKKGGKR